MANHGRLVGRRKAVASVLLATQIAACSSWRVETAPATRLLDEGPKAPFTVRVTRADQSKVVLRSPSVVRDSLRGWTQGTEIGIPLTDVRAIASQHGDVVKSLLLGMAIVGVAVAGIYAAAMSTVTLP